MKQRMITVVFGIALLLLILLFYKTVVLNIAIAIVAMVAVYEVFAATKNIKSTGLFCICLVFAAVLPFLHYFPSRRSGEIISFVFLAAVFIFMIFRHGTFRVEQAALCFMMTLLSSYSLSCIAFLRDAYSGDVLKDVALFYIVLVFVGAWVTDAGGYLFGSLLGRHKLSPEISPKKTVEGAVGGVILNAVIFVAIALGYDAYLRSFGTAAHFNFALLLILAIVSAVLSILGDLSASIIKRQNGIKDFGNLLPGHGGILDRFDSILFVAPLILFFLRFFPIVSA